MAEKKQEQKEKDIEETKEINQEKAEEKVEEVKSDNTDAIILKLNGDLEEQKKKTEEYYEHLKRNMAEFDNYKKRTEKEKATLYTSISADVFSSLLPVIDNLENALGSECSDEKYKTGISMIYKDLKEILQKQGLEEIESLNKTFDPNLHEAVMHEEDETKGEKEITLVLRKGYKIGEKVIRHTMVKVAN